MVDIFGMTLEVISRPFNIELLRLCHFVVFLQLLLDMVLLMQILLKTDIVHVALLMLPVVVFLSVIALK